MPYRSNVTCLSGVPRADGVHGILAVVARWAPSGRLEDPGCPGAVEKQEDGGRRLFRVVVCRLVGRRHVGLAERPPARLLGELDGLGSASPIAVPRPGTGVDRVSHDLAVARQRRDDLGLRGERHDTDAVAIGSLSRNRRTAAWAAASRVGGTSFASIQPELSMVRTTLAFSLWAATVTSGRGQGEQCSGERQEEEDGREPAAPGATLVDDPCEHLDVREADRVLRAAPFEHYERGGRERNDGQQRQQQWPLEAHERPGPRVQTAWIWSFARGRAPPRSALRSRRVARAADELDRIPASWACSARGAELRATACVPETRRLTAATAGATAAMAFTNDSGSNASLVGLPGLRRRARGRLSGCGRRPPWGCNR